MSTPPLTPPMSSLLPTFRSALQSFTASTCTLRILHTIPPHPSPPPPSTLYILDSSFNPPTRAHLHLATSALLSHRSPHPPRLLLLLATHNADKAPLPAPFPHRLAMMTLFATDLLHTLSAQHPPSDRAPEPHIAVDIAITSLPHFHAKSAALASSHPDHVLLLGYDTLTRLLDPKYYPPTHTLAPLAPLFAHHRVRATYRTDDGWGGRAEQERFVEGLRAGEMEGVGGRREWAGRIELVEGRGEGEERVSSTRVREVVGRGEGGRLEGLVTPGVGEWILREGLYKGEDGGEGRE